MSPYYRIYFPCLGINIMVSEYLTLYNNNNNINLPLKVFYDIPKGRYFYGCPLFDTDKENMCNFYKLVEGMNNTITR